MTCVRVASLATRLCCAVDSNREMTILVHHKLEEGIDLVTPWRSSVSQVEKRGRHGSTHRLVSLIEARGATGGWRSSRGKTNHEMMNFGDRIIVH